MSLPSHSSKTEFPGNSSNSFKIRLPHPIQLEGGGWKVGLVSISLPDLASKVPALLKSQYANLFKTYWLASNTLLVDRDIAIFSAVFEPRDLRGEDLSRLTGKDFMNLVRGFFDKKKIDKVLQPSWKIAETDGTNQMHTHFEWHGDDFMIHNDDVKLTKVNNSYSTAQN